MLKRTSLYGDHTSFPGEFIIHYVPMLAMGLRFHPATLDYEHQNIQGIDKKGFWIIAIPKILLTILSLYLFYLLCKEFLVTNFGIFVAFSIFFFNQYLVYAAFSLRPYGILPELFIINIYMASRKDKTLWFDIGHGTVIFLTCINHAYGPLMSFLPILYFKKPRCLEFYPLILVALIAWVYYASYSNFGMNPNTIQSVLDPFKYIKQENLFEFIFQSLFCTSVITTAILPFILMKSFDPNTGLLGKKWGFLITLVLIPLIAIILIDLKTHYIIHPRQYVWILPALGLWCGMLIEKGLK